MAIRFSHNLTPLVLFYQKKKCGKKNNKKQTKMLIKSTFRVISHALVNKFDQKLHYGEIQYDVFLGFFLYILRIQLIGMTRFFFCKLSA